MGGAGGEDIDEDDVSARGLAILIGVFLVPLLLIYGITGGISWWHERDLRGGGLLRAKARIVDFDGGGRMGRDEYEVEFIAEDGTRVRAEVPIGHGVSADEGKQVDVRYVASAPHRVRTVEDWQPWYQQATVYAAMFTVIGFVLFIWMKWVQPMWRQFRKRG